MICDLEREERNYTNVLKIFILLLPNRKRRLLIQERKRFRDIDIHLELKHKQTMTTILIHASSIFIAR